MSLFNGLLIAGKLIGEPDTIFLENNNDDFSKNSIEVFQGPKTSFKRLNIFYTLPFETSAYTFVDFNDNGFYVKTTTNTPIYKGTGLRTKAKHSNNFDDQINIGLEQKINYKGINASFRALPLGLDKSGIIKDHFLFSYSLNKTFPGINLKVGSFGEMNIKNGISWNYGELFADFNIPTKHGKFILGTGYNFNRSKDKSFFDPKFRVKIGYHPKR